MIPHLQLLVKRKIFLYKILFTSILTPQPYPPLPVCLFQTPALPVIMCKPPDLYIQISGPPSPNNNLHQSPHFPWRCKTIAGNNPWPTSAKSRVQYGRSEGRAVLSFQVTADWSPVFIDLRSISDFRIVIAIAFPIKNRSGKIADRFSFRNRSVIFRSKSDRVFHSKIDQRLKNRSHCISTVRAINRGSIFVRKSISVFHFKIDQRFSC